MNPQGRVRIQWTETARKGLKALPQKVRAGIIQQADALLDADNLEKVGKPLAGPLAGYRSIKYSRYRAIYTHTKEKLANGGVLIHVTVTFIAAGKRKEGDKKDIYQLAKKLIKWGLDEIGTDDEQDV